MAVFLVDYENTGVSGLHGIEALAPGDRVFVFYGDNAGSIPFDRHICMTSSSAVIRYLRVARSGKNYLDFQIATYTGYLIASGTDKEIHIVSNDGGFDSVIDFWAAQNPAVTVTKRPTLSSPDADVKSEPHGKKKTERKRKTEDKADLQPKNEPSADLAADGDAKSSPSDVGENDGGKKAEKKTSARGRRKKQSEPDGERPDCALSEKLRQKLGTKLSGEALADDALCAFYKLFADAKNRQDFNIALVKMFRHEQGNRIYKLTVAEHDKYIKRTERALEADADQHTCE